MHSQKTKILIPIRRKRSVRPDMLEVPDGVKDSRSGRGHLIGFKSLFPEQLENRPGSDGR